MESWLEPVHDAETMRAADRWAIEERGIPSLDLMEAAGTALAEACEARAESGPVRIVCGKGNNGGDGIVAARVLASFGHDVEVLLLAPPGELSADAAANLERFDGSVEALGDAGWEDALAGSGCVADAIFGTGFSGSPREPASTAIAAINGCGAPVVAADIASGVDASTGEVEGVAVEADATVSFHAAKLGHLIAPGKWCCGELVIAPIGIPDGAPGEPAGRRDRRRGARARPAADRCSTKFSSGEVMMVGGSRGLTGGLHERRGGDPGRRRIRDGRGPRRARVDLRDQADRGDVAWDADPRRRPHRGRAEADSRRGEARRGRRSRARNGPLARVPPLVHALTRKLDAPLVIDADGLHAVAADRDSLVARRAPPCSRPTPASSPCCSKSSRTRSPPTARVGGKAAARDPLLRRAQGRGHDRRRARRRARGQRGLEPGARHRRHRRRALRPDRGAARARSRAVPGGVRRAAPTPAPAGSPPSASARPSR